ncbi:MAG TPA: sigma-54-dependent Fis family transcriptional regulator [Deltaproteobacteria bacterium]|nr:sigma-54-dependent Fis family transcriptional regulator [Deltaproteobacteria bacterium]
MELPRARFLIGRSSECDLCLPDAEISRKHAEIFFENNYYVLNNISSTHTLLNGSEISSPSVLLEGQKIDIGSWQLKFKQSKIPDEESQGSYKTALTYVSGDTTRLLSLNPETDTCLLEKTILVIKNPSGDELRVPFSKRKMLLGSSSSCDVVVKDDYVSGRHCEMSLQDEGIVVTDLHSTNGTHVAGNKIVSCLLKATQSFTVGQTALTFCVQQQEETLNPIPEPEFCGMVGKALSMQKLFAKIAKVAPTTHTVLVQGETGSGKELVARALHLLSLRRGKPYLVLNCGAISRSLIESELFGHEKGSFTGAVVKRMGAFEQVQGGSLFLDEIGELPLELQPALLRALENRTIRRVGGNAEISVDVRVIAATHRDLLNLVKQGRFREDLYYRLFVVPLEIPSLKERKEDIPLLISHFLKEAGVSKTFSEKALAKFSDYEWPGNIRELKNSVLRSLIFSEKEIIEASEVDLVLKEEEAESINLDEVEKNKIDQALLKTEGNKARAAELLGIAKSTLFKKLKDYNI